MESEKVGETSKQNERHPPRELPFLCQIRDLYSRYAKRERKQKKAETDHQRNERMMAQWTARVGYFTAFLVLFSAVGNWIIYGQLKEMRSGGDDTKRLVEAARSPPMPPKMPWKSPEKPLNFS